MSNNRLAYNYAIINATGYCIGVMTYSYQVDDPTYIDIGEYNENYLLKYYNNGNWYEDAAFTIPWSPT